MKGKKAYATGFIINGNTTNRSDPVFKKQKQQDKT